MSGIIAWLSGFLDGNVGKYTYRATAYRSYTFMSTTWAGAGTEPTTGFKTHWANQATQVVE